MFSETIRFILCSSIEACAGMALIVSIFRISPLPYIWPASFMFLVINLVSYMLRKEQLSYLAPVMVTILYVLVISLLTHVPLLWSIIMTATGMLIYTLLQTAVILILYGSFNTDMQYSWEGSIVQLVISTLTFCIVWFLLRYHIGFTADFERLRFKFEHIAVLLFIVAALILLSTLIYFNNLYYIIIYMFLLSSILIYYVVKKEVKYD